MQASARFRKRGRSPGAAAATYSITGTVTLDGSPANNRTVNLTGASSASTTTNASGVYTFSSLLAGSYTVAPAAVAQQSSSPPSRAVTLGPDSTGRNFSILTDI